jgi:primosomal protein N''
MTEITLRRILAEIASDLDDLASRRKPVDLAHVAYLADRLVDLPKQVRREQTRGTLKAVRR